MWAVKGVLRKDELVLREWFRPLDAAPEMGAAVVKKRGSGACWLVVFAAGRVIRRIPVRHPAGWGVSQRAEEECVAQYVQKVVETEKHKRRLLGDAAAAWVGAHPALWEFLTLEAFDDGTARQLAMLCMFYEDGVLKVALQDRQEGRTLWTAAQSPVDALDALEATLQAGEGEWRRSRGPGSGGAGQKGRKQT